MKDLKLKLEELKKYIGKTDDESRLMFESIMSEIESFSLTEDERVFIQEFLSNGISEMNANIDSIEKEINIREQLKEAINVLPLSYIAKHYFGKSASWLYQRINGYKVRGHVYTLNNKEKEVFNQALKEIGNKISSLSIG